MLTHGFWFLIVDALAVYRLAILITQDAITARFRDLLTGRAPLVKRPRVAVFITCPWCVSIWIGAGVVVLTRLWPDGWQYVALALALSGVTGFLAER